MPSRRLDALVAWLMRPRVRRARRWSFLLTLPASLAVAHLYGVQHGALVLGGRLLFWLLVVAAAWRLGGERGEAVRDVLMHPRIRAFCRAELDVLTALPRLLAVRAGGRAAPGARYDRGTFGAALAFAFTPAVLAEAVALHLLAGGGWIAWVLTAAHGYSLVWLWGFALGPRAYPHRLSARDALFRAGPLYRVRVPRAVVVGAAVRRERLRSSERGAVERDGALLLPVRGRVDVWLELAEPVRVQRALGEPLPTRRLAVASDDPEGLVAALLAAAVVGAGDRPAAAGRRVLGVPAALELAGLARDAVQPA